MVEPANEVGLLDAGILARVENKDWQELLREDMEDSLKEYSELDLLVELIQNALDAIEQRRFHLICEAAQQDPDSAETVEKWNQAVIELIESDNQAYGRATDSVDRAKVYKKFRKDASRRELWWEVLSKHLNCQAKDLMNAASSFEPMLAITVRLDDICWIEIEDNGLGMANIVSCFRHKDSTKRDRGKKPRRLGLRGSHGWGLTAVLAMSNDIRILSRIDGGAPSAFSFSGYSEFCRGRKDSPVNRSILLDDEADNDFSYRLLHKEGETGTHIRVKLGELPDTSLLGQTLGNYGHEKFANLLRLYTPVGQVNDFLLNPAYHNLRRQDLSITLRSLVSGEVEQSDIPFDVFRVSEQEGVPYKAYDEFINDGMPSNVSIHTIHRVNRNGSFYLSAAEIQSAKEVISVLEGKLCERDALPVHVDENGKEICEIPRGFYLALSGGMKAELLVRPPRSTSAAFRGFVLSETAHPTLGRKHVMDQRMVFPKTAADHESLYDKERRAVLPKAIAPVFSAAGAKWKRQLIDRVRGDLEPQKPLTPDVRIWAGTESYEARVMLVFSALLQKGVFGDFTILRAHLKDKYDFIFLYRCEAAQNNTPSVATLEGVHTGGYGEWEGSDKRKFRRYGLGEFKASGEALLQDFNPDEPSKAAEAIDLLVCWSFDKETVEDSGWMTEPALSTNMEFEGQTHIWNPTGQQIGRTRALPVVSLETVIAAMIDRGQFKVFNDDVWPSILPENYF